MPPIGSNTTTAWKSGTYRVYPVKPGGSAVFNRADLANTFGLGTEKVDRYKAVYNTFGNLMVRMYPSIMPNFMPYEKAVDKSFLLSVISNHPELLEGKAMETKSATEITAAVSVRSYHIEFETGSAAIRPESYKTLNDIFESAVVAEGLKVGVFGYTDNNGGDEVNMPLSEKRAASVKDWLVRKGLKDERIEAKGFAFALACSRQQHGSRQEPYPSRGDRIR